MSIRKLDPQEPAEVSYYEGYNRGHRDTAKMLARRSLMYLLVGMFFGGGLMFLVANAGVLDRLGAEPVVEDPALSQEKPKQYVNAINWAKRFTVGIVAKSPDRAVRAGDALGRIPGQTHVGSGVILSADGYILTNAHVIPSDATELSVVLGDDLYEARFVGHRPEYDLAVIKVNAKGLVPASLGDSDKAEQGDVVVAIGSPHGLFHTATEGIISYAGRRSEATGTLVRNYLQTSAAINPGNSGGPLIDLTGRVIGINTWKLASQGPDGSDSIGFAIPINTARRVFEAIINADDRNRDSTISSRPRSLQSAFLGVSIDDGYRPERGEEGARVRSVIYATAADKAGLQAGDLIVDIGGSKVTGLDDLRTALAGRQPGEKVQVTYVRNGQSHTIEVTLGE
ncbi:MAG: trypsin-like peptidase domain-containing protein [Planctomycetes bacterium]|nr:trypsin-like peptidase domain-containing protein [Planctomycetota bacterium]